MKTISGRSMRTRSISMDLPLPISDILARCKTPFDGCGIDEFDVVDRNEALNLIQLFDMRQVRRGRGYQRVRTGIRILGTPSKPSGDFRPCCTRTYRSVSRVPDPGARTDTILYPSKYSTPNPSAYCKDNCSGDRHRRSTDTDVTQRVYPSSQIHHDENFSSFQRSAKAASVVSASQRSAKTG